MIIPGRLVFTRQIVQNLLSTANQVQPCGIDLTLKRVLQWKSAGVVDFDNKQRRTASTEEIPFDPETRIHLPLGSYLVEFNEVVDTP